MEQDPITPNPLDENQESTASRPGEEADKAKQPGSMSRRQLCAGIGGAAALLALGGVKYLPSTPVVRPPGAQDENAFLAACVRCQKCYEICPRGVIAPSHLENGIVQMRTPTMDFSENWCDFCTEKNNGRPLCAEACPTGAIAPPANATAESVIIGKAVIKEEWCLAYRLTGCKLCYDVCPYDAIELDSEGRPYVIESRCNGCGACESVCVSLSSGSISHGASSRAIIVKTVNS